MIHDPRPDARTAVFCSTEGPEVFSGVVHGNQIWTRDPFDVADIHAEARAAFAHLVARGSSSELPVHGKTLLLLGEAGSGKTHLLRAFRTAAHAQGGGYCGYLQMTSRLDDYARYVLANLIDSLQQPYRPDDPEEGATTGLERLARGLLATVPVALRAPLMLGEVADLDDLARLVHRVSHAVAVQPQFAGVDIDLVRAILYLLPNDGLVHALALKWLRCEELSRFDRESLGDLVPRPGPDMPMRTIVGLGKLMSAAHSATLVLLVDQIEEVIELSHVDGTAGPMLRGAINTLVDVADALPNAIVVVACLDDLFSAGRHFLPAPKLDRLEHDPAPVRLVSKRTPVQVRAIVEKRLGVLFESVGVAVDPNAPTAPFTDRHLSIVAGLRTRDVVGFCRAQRERCIAAGRWVDPDEDDRVPPIVDERPPAAVADLGRQWNDFLAEWELGGVIGESTLADLLAWVVRVAPAELADGTRVDAWPEGRFVTLEVTSGTDVRPTSSVRELIVRPPSVVQLREDRVLAVCDVTPRGPHLLRQIDEVVEWAGERPAVLVRSTEYPSDATSGVGERLGRLDPHIRPVVVQNADWRAMEAFREFHSEHHGEDRFWDWQRADRPLTRLSAVRAILDLDRSLASVPYTETSLSEGPTAVPDADAPDRLRIGRGRTVGEGVVEIDPASLARHAMFVGGPGSGTTTAALCLLEELLLRGVPAVVVDRTGDFARYADPRSWEHPETDRAQFARRQLLRTRIDVRLHTPGADEGHPLVVPVAPPDLHELADSDRTRISGHIAAALGAWMGYRSKGQDPKLAILQAAIELLDQVGLVSVPSLQDLIRERDTGLLLNLAGIDDRHFETLLEDLETLWLRNRHLLDGGDVLDFERAFRPTQLTRLTIVDTRFLGDEATVDFFTSGLLVAVDRWAAAHPAAEGVLQAAVLVDEAERCLPATGRAPSARAPLESLLARAGRSGVTVLLSARSPADLDYRSQTSIGTWFVGRLKDKSSAGKLRPMFDAARTEPGTGLESGELHLLDGADARAFLAEPNLVPSRPLTGDEVVRLAKDLAP